MAKENIMISRKFAANKQLILGSKVNILGGEENKLI